MRDRFFVFKGFCILRRQNNDLTVKNKDIRWQQRFNNYKKALSQLQKFIDKGELNELETQGLIKAFEYTYELAWNVIKDYYEFQGAGGIQGSRDAFRMAYTRGLLPDGETWQEMVDSRIKSSHTYDEVIANEVVHDILHKYYALFVSLRNTMETILSAA